MNEYVIYTDGCAEPNPGRGGWGYIILAKDSQKDPLAQNCGGFSYTTNNRMEIYAVLAALRAVKHKSKITIVSDSEYVVNTINGWLKGWVNKRFSKKKNVDLWKQIWILMGFHSVSARWVRGHNGDYYNNIADRLANTGTKGAIEEDVAFLVSQNTVSLFDPG